MPRSGGRDLAVGAMFALGLITLALGIMAVGGDSGLFFDRSRYIVVFPSTDGLLVGAPVRIAGVEVGTVDDISLPADPSRQGITVSVVVDSKFAVRVRQDSTAALRILQLLTSEKFVEIVPGTGDAPPLDPGGEIPILQEPEFFERGEAIAENLNEVAVSLRRILGSLERGDGLIGQMLFDPEFGKEGLEALRGTLENAETLTADLLEGQGAMGRMLKDEKLAGSLDGLAHAVESFSVLMQALANHEGAAGEFLREGGSAELALQDAREAMASVKRIVARLELPEGLAGRLLHDTEYSEALAVDLRTTVHNLAEISEKVNRGEGTLGALVNDRVLYDGAEEVIAGVNDSKFARWLLRHYRKQGIKAQDKADTRRGGQGTGGE